MNLFILAHRSLKEYITKNDKNNYEEFSKFLEYLRQKEFDERSEKAQRLTAQMMRK